jgi:hypothetical protein
MSGNGTPSSDPFNSSPAVFPSLNQPTPFGHSFYNMPQHGMAQLPATHHGTQMPPSITHVNNTPFTPYSTCQEQQEVCQHQIR